MTLKQKHAWDKRTFELDDHTIKVKIKNTDNEVEVTYRLEQLGRDLIKYKNNKPSLFIIFLMLTFIIAYLALLKDYTPKNTLEMVIMILIWTFITVTVGYVIYALQKMEIGIVGGEKEIAFLESSPNKEEVDVFIKSVLSKRKKLIILRGLNLDDLAYSNNYRLSYLKELLNERYINEEEFKEYQKLFEDSSKNIGF